MNPLFAVRNLMRQLNIASSAHIAYELQLPVDVVDDMLIHWQRRGFIEPLESISSGGCTSGKCGSCSSGGCTPVKQYRWIQQTTH
ncbi:MAG: hypothetical protein CENE_02892 [Candidatus Celerinatantimonas neptuna]|nr:MAG: hypothetical protein CENE_02892 [Candidatus Celerinatantimonas neptuna]